VVVVVVVVLYTLHAILELAVQLRLASNSQSSCLSCLCAGVVDVLISGFLLPEWQCLFKILQMERENKLSY
jgi:hypothetical protein